MRAHFVAILMLLVAAPGAAAATGAAGAPTKTVRAGKVTLGYRSIGTGRPIVLVMGLGGTMDTWDPAFLDELAAQGRRVVVFDNEGIGRSTARPGTLTVRHMGDDTAALIAALGLGRPDVAGWSMGGMIAQSLAVRHPGSVRRLVLMATAPGDGKFVAPRADGAAVLSTSPLDPVALLGQLFPPGQQDARDRYIRDVGMRKNPVTIAPQDVVSRQIVASGLWLTAKDRDGARVRKLKLPVLIGGGVKDHLLPVGNQRHLAKVIPGAKLVTYAGAAHGFLYQHAADFLRRVDAFLKR